MKTIWHNQGRQPPSSLSLSLYLLLLLHPAPPHPSALETGSLSPDLGFLLALSRAQSLGCGLLLLKTGFDKGILADLLDSNVLCENGLFHFTPISLFLSDFSEPKPHSIDTWTEYFSHTLPMLLPNLTSLFFIMTGICTFNRAVP